jgi:hypothetical protein
MVAAAVRLAGRSWARVAVVGAWTVLGMLVFVAPATIRNGLQVDHWLPSPTNNAGAMCQGHSPRSQLVRIFDDPQELQRCYGGGRPFGHGLSEAEWYRTTMSEAVRYAISHPLDEVRLTLEKTVVTLGSDRTGGELSFAQFSGSVLDPIWTLIEWWRGVVLVLATAALLAVVESRRAVLVWLPAALILASVVTSVSAGRLGAPIFAFLTVPAGLSLARSGEVGLRALRRCASWLPW